MDTDVTTPRPSQPHPHRMVSTELHGTFTHSTSTISVAVASSSTNTNPTHPTIQTSSTPIYQCDCCPSDAHGCLKSMQRGYLDCCSVVLKYIDICGICSFCICNRFFCLCCPHHHNSSISGTGLKRRTATVKGSASSSDLQSFFLKTTTNGSIFPRNSCFFKILMILCGAFIALGFNYFYMNFLLTFLVQITAGVGGNVFRFSHPFVTPMMELPFDETSDTFYSVSHIDTGSRELESLRGQNTNSQLIPTHEGTKPSNNMFPTSSMLTEDGEVIPSDLNGFPRIIHQSYINESVLPSRWNQTTRAWKEMHPGWKYMFWSDEDNRNLIKAHYPWFLKTFDEYPHDIQRADAARYFVIYHHGGVYSDFDIQPKVNLEILPLHRLDVLLVETPNLGVTNSIFAARKRSDFMLYLILHLKTYRKTWYMIFFGRHLEILFSTGPSMFWATYGKYQRKGTDRIGILSKKYFGKSSICEALVCNYLNKKRSLFKHLHGNSWHSDKSNIFHFFLQCYFCLTLIVIFMGLAVVHCILCGSSVSLDRIKRRNSSTRPNLSPIHSSESDDGQPPPQPNMLQRISSSDSTDDYFVHSPRDMSCFSKICDFLIWYFTTRMSWCKQFGLFLAAAVLVCVLIYISVSVNFCS